MNRDAIEQEAMQFLQRGNSEKALDRYLAILRHEPKDRRIRQKVAELYLALGKRAEAARHLADVARSLRSAGQDRAAIAAYTQLVELKGDDLEIRAELAECLEAAGRKAEARRQWEDAFQAVERKEPRKAIEFARKVARLAPAETPLHVRVAELLEAARQEAEAFEAWRQLGEEARRLGRTDDRVRFFERALKLRPQDGACLLAAAEGRLSLGEPRPALAHLQVAYVQDPRSIEVLTLLGRALQALDQKDKARKVWLQAARRLEEAGRLDAQAEALKSALDCGEDDPQIRAQLDRVTADATRQRMRLHERPWAQPATAQEVAVITRASVLHRYGFTERAVALLQRDEAVRGTLAGQAWLGELLLLLGRQAEGERVLLAMRPHGAAAVDHGERLAVLGLKAETSLPRDETEEVVLDDDDTSPPGGELAVPVQRASAPAAEAAPPSSNAEASGDELAARGEITAAIQAYRRALAEDPGNTEVLLKIGELMTNRPRASQAPTATPLPPPPPSSRPPTAPPSEPPAVMAMPDLSAHPLGGFDLGGASEELALEPEGDALFDARALLSVGLYDEAMDRLRGRDELEALVLQALAARGQGAADQGMGRLERAVQSGSPHDPAYVEALWELSGLYLLRKRLGNAERLLDELASLDPGWRPVELAARRRGIELLRAR